MLKTSYFKSKPTNDYFKLNVYSFDSILAVAIDAFISTMNTPEMKTLHPNHDKFQLNNIKNSIELTNKILELEYIDNIRVEQNNSSHTSTCSYNKITYSEKGMVDQETAFHEMAHLFETVFTVNDLPSHHVSFLATFEYLLDKYNFLNKSIFKDMVKKYKNLTLEDIPYIENFFTITEHNLSDYDTILNSFLDNKEYNGFKCNKLFINDNFERVIFESHNHYLILLVNKNNKTTFRKIIQKKLAFEMQVKKNYDLIISPKFMSFRDFGTIRITHNQSYYTHDSIAIFINSKHFDAYLLLDLINNNIKLTEKYMFTVQVDSNNMLILGINADFNNGSTRLIKLINTLFKKHNISYYNTKSQNDFTHKTNYSIYF